MDWLYVLMPIAGVDIFWPGLVILGIGVGIIGGFFGMGGAWASRWHLLSEQILPTWQANH